MEEIPVCIVGAGPAGLVLGLSLAKFRIRSLILEKDAEITDDPRGVFLTHDACRILWDLNIGGRMDEIGHLVPHVNFHQSSFANPPFYRMKTSTDSVNQALPNGILQVQPHLEWALRDAVEASEHCELRRGCEVRDCERLSESLLITYTDASKDSRKIKSSWLVGADGKRGVVRKYFLEPTAGIKQQDAAYRYEGVWVAANLRMTVPTSSSHPDFPLWKLGYSSEQVYDLFWPIGWHFASPPGKATATGRFGPHSARLWRHEFEQSDWDDSMDAEYLLWEHLTPMITRSTDGDGKRFECGNVQYPRDCISILRCRPFKFAHKVVNRWFDGRTVLIGDAAHVFPPFGGQGIASGLRDAHQLAWRLALLLQLGNTDQGLTDKVLTAWSAERASSVRDAALLTKINGDLCNGIEPLLSKLFRWTTSMMHIIPLLPTAPNPIAIMEGTGFTKVRYGHFAHNLGGGGRVAQVWIRQEGESPFLSDALFRHGKSVMTLLLVGDTSELQRLGQDAKQVISNLKVPAIILNDASIMPFQKHRSDPCAPAQTTVDNMKVIYHICSKDVLERQRVDLIEGYDETAFFKRFAKNARYVIVRPDFYVYAMANNTHELTKCLEGMVSMFTRD